MPCSSVLIPNALPSMFRMELIALVKVNSSMYTSSPGSNTVIGTRPNNWPAPLEIIRPWPSGFILCVFTKRSNVSSASRASPCIGPYCKRLIGLEWTTSSKAFSITSTGIASGAGLPIPKLIKPSTPTPRSNTSRIKLGPFKVTRSGREKLILSPLSYIISSKFWLRLEIATPQDRALVQHSFYPYSSCTLSIV